MCCVLRTIRTIDAIIQHGLDLRLSLAPRLGDRGDEVAVDVVQQGLQLLSLRLLRRHGTEGSGDSQRAGRKMRFVV